jgi:alpha-tubulin suppressor-like RCC1 family protein
MSDYNSCPNTRLSPHLLRRARTADRLERRFATGFACGEATKPTLSRGSAQKWRTMRFSLVRGLFGAAALGLLSTTGVGHAASEVVGWGRNDYGQTNIPSGLSNVVAIAAGQDHSLALTAEGRVVGWGFNGEGLMTIPGGLSNVVAIAAGRSHSLALTVEGRVVGWGYNYNGQTTIPSGLSNVVAIAAENDHNLALTGEGRVVGWGANNYGESNVPSGLSNVVAIAAGGDLGLALTAEGRMMGWGGNASGETTIPSGLSNVVAIAGGGSHSLALTAEGRVVGFCDNSYGQTTVPSRLSHVVAIAAGYQHSLALIGDGTPAIALQPVSQSVTAGGTVTFQVRAVWAVGTPPLRYQWLKDGMGLPGQTNAVLRLVGVTASHAGNYAVIVSNFAGGSTTSSSATLTVNCLLDVASTSGGSVTRNPDLPIYAGYSQVTLTATPAADYGFVRWSGDATSSTNPLIVTLDTNKNITAVFASVTLTVATQGAGTVVKVPDQAGYAPGSLVTLTAIPALGYGFIRWTGDATGSTNPLIVNLDTNKNVTAVFASTALTLASQGVGTIIRVPDKVFYMVDDRVTLTATAGRWHVFSGWTDGVTNNPRLVTIGENNAYTAAFTPTISLETVTIGNVTRLAPVGMPAVVVDATFILADFASARGSAPITLSTTFPNGTLFYTLDGSDPLAGSLYTGPFSVAKGSLLRTVAYNADFTQWVAGDPLDIIILPTLTGVTEGGGSVAIAPPSGAYFSNDLATVTATAAPGWIFLQWLGDATGTNPAVSVHMTRNKTVQAVFGTKLNTTVVGSGSILLSPVSSLYPCGNTVRLTAVPATGNYLSFWANAAAGQTNNPLLFTVTNANPTVMAVFASLGGAQANALTVIPNGRGQVTLTPPGNRFPSNSNVALQATPDAGQEFLGWSGSASGSQNPLVVTMDSSKVITASFTQRPWLRGESNPEMLRQDGFRLTLTGEFGVAYQILGSTDLSAWTPLVTVTNDWGTVQFTDGAGTNHSPRFYRGVLR